MLGGPNVTITTVDVTDGVGLGVPVGCGGSEAAGLFDGLFVTDGV